MKTTKKATVAEGTDVNAKDEYGDTPLHDAAREGDSEAVEILIANGADVNAINNRGKTPLDQVKL